MITPYHAKYFAYELTKHCPSDSLEKLAGAVASAQVDLNPHQVDAALFAFQSPLSKGALLADEVGLGKTIEAGLVISQRWAERKRRIVVQIEAALRARYFQYVPGEAKASDRKESLCVALRLCVKSMRLSSLNLQKHLTQRRKARKGRSQL